MTPRAYSKAIETTENRLPSKNDFRTVKYNHNTMNALVWDLAPCGFIINRRFGGMRRLHLQRRKMKAGEEKY
jgi:hypothetical protein